MEISRNDVFWLHVLPSKPFQSLLSKQMNDPNEFPEGYILEQSFAHFSHICSHLKRRSVEENYDDNLKQLLKAAGGILTGNKQGDVGKWRRLWNQKEIALYFISQPSVNGKHIFATQNIKF